MYSQVLNFTRETSRDILPERPVKLSREKVEFLVGMILSECNELLQTVCEDMEDCRETTLKLINTDIKDVINKPETEEDAIADQGDAMVDIIYYIENAASKNCINLDDIFDEVHSANMRKRDPNTGNFIIRATDGKVLKPEGWVGPDIKKVLFSRILDEGEDYMTIPDVE
jgi:predicted HAD superfamily Cof-like phosphohydrolase